jgi:hypothetical protein
MIILITLVLPAFAFTQGLSALFEKGSPVVVQIQVKEKEIENEDYLTQLES